MIMLILGVFIAANRTKTTPCWRTALYSTFIYLHNYSLENIGGMQEIFLQSDLPLAIQKSIFQMAEVYARLTRAVSCQR